MSDKKTVEEQIRELEEEYADSIKEAQSQPGLREMEIVYGAGSSSMLRLTHSAERESQRS